MSRRELLSLDVNVDTRTKETETRETEISTMARTANEVALSTREDVFNVSPHAADINPSSVEGGKLHMKATE